MSAVAAFASAPTAAAVAVEHISKSFIDAAGVRLSVLEDVSFSLQHGEIVALLGSSGCGKSTLLNVIAGLQPADSGKVIVDGHEVTRHSTPSLGYVFQDDRLLPWRTALRNVTFSLEAGSMRQVERDTRARKVLDLMNLAPFAGAYPHQLSGGMRSRVALARSLVLDPRIMLMDEPFGRLDAQTRAQMHVEVLRIKDLLGMSIIFVTHDVDEAVVLADRVIVLAPRTGCIKACVEINLPRPRDPTTPQAAIHIRELKGHIR